MNEIKKVGLQQTKVKEDEPTEPDEPYEQNEADENKESNDIIFNKEEEITIPIAPIINEIATNEIATNEIDTNSYIPMSTDENIYKDPEDPTNTQIENATQNIIINDITEPVVENTYDNTEIVTDNIVDNTDTSKKLNEMMNELKNTSISTDTSIKPVTTEIKSKANPLTSVIKIDGPPSIIKLDPEPVKDYEPMGIIKLDPEPIKEPEQPSFSFSNLYPNLSGTGKVEDITKDINASVMKEVISLDKKEDEIDETITLDNFFNDVKQMSNPMAPIQEENKYTLFEDASIKE